MKKYLVLLDFDGTLVERSSEGVSEKIPFKELEAVRSKYASDFSVSLEYRIVTSSCAKSIENIMTMSDLSLIDQWDFENGLHIRRYQEFREQLISNQDTEEFARLKPKVLERIQQCLSSLDGVQFEISDKKCSIAIHCSSHRNPLYETLSQEFGGDLYLVKSALFTVEIFPKNWDKSAMMRSIKKEDYDLIIFIGDSIYQNGNDYDLANHSSVDIAIEVKNASDSKKLLHNMKSMVHRNPLHDALLNGTQARVVSDKSSLFQPNVEALYTNKKFILLDFDGTLTFDRGRLYPGIVDVLMKLRETYKIWILTGRSKGWADMMVHTLPVDGVIGENGAFAFYYDPNDHEKILTWTSSYVDPKYKEKIETFREQIKSKYPFIKLSSDQFSRAYDLAAIIDEEGIHLSKDQIDELHFWAKKQGAEAAISNIHVNIWFGHYNKAQSVIDLFYDVYGIHAMELCRSSFFIGDSPNDEPMFRLINASFGVKNVEMFKDDLRYPPHVISNKFEGAGAYEILQIIYEKKPFLYVSKC